MNVDFIPFPEDKEFPKPDLSKKYSLINEKKEEIGTIEGSVNIYGELVTVVKIYGLENQQKGIGFSSFKRIFNELNELVEINTIKSSWLKGEEFQFFEDCMSTNLRIFQTQRNLGKPIEECAFGTPTGKWAQKLGFHKCEIIRITTEEVCIDFKK